MKKKILFTTPVLEYPAAGGPQLRIENSIKALNKISELHVISRVTPILLGGLFAERYYKNLCYRFLYSPSALMKFKDIFFYRIKKIKKLLFSNEEKYDFDSYCLERDSAFILKYAKRNDIGIIWFGYGCVSYDLIKKIREKDAKIKCICDTDSVLSRYLLRGLPYQSSIEEYKKIEAAGRKKEKEERDFVKICNITTAVSDFDAQYYKELSNIPGNVKIFSNVIDISNYSIHFNPPVNFKNPCIYLAGSFGPKSPMDQAARWFIKDIFPLIKKEIPNVHFYILGSRADETLFDIVDDSITVVGKVETVLPYLQHCDVAIVPLMFESGTRFKIIEAGACGIPVVSTVLGAEGLNVTHGKDIFISDDPEKFANFVSELLKNKVLAKQVGNNLKELITKQYGIEKLVQEGNEIIQSI